FLYEAGGASALGSIHPHPVPNLADGTIDIDRLRRAIRNPSDPHQPPTRLICLENTHNRCGGVVLTSEYTDAVADLAHAEGISVHLDGARLFNASVATGIPPAELARGAESVMVCLSKGLGCPVGSVLCGERGFIERARRMRKLVGGGMRQAGIIAAAGIYALENNVERLAEDHENARRLAAGIAEIEGLSSPQAGPPPTAWTNLIYFEIDPDAVADRSLTADILVERLRDKGVLALPVGGEQIRMVTHLDVGRSDIETALDALRSAVNGT
ncbi:MAG TPA: aminotransferase class I/II-fold pyridoxal phosphate-dependent enzyme, partial [Candidatus Acetothermia bacterium]|nr:aminotransferase class I/II-fold pyridoxal phosphate-dependent enzyme [Candidatus Acetothermia bacterium]